MKARPGEKIGSGLIVMARSKTTGRYVTRQGTTPFEHVNLRSAQMEAARLAELNEKCTFEICVFSQRINPRPVE